MKRVLVRLYVRVTGLTLEQLREGFAVNYFLTRSAWRAYWLTLKARA